MKRTQRSDAPNVWKSHGSTPRKKSTQRSSMIRAFVSKILRVTVDVLHGKNRSLCWTFNNNCWQESPSCTCVRARIVPKQTPAACTWNHRKIQECASRAFGPWGPRKESASTRADISAVLLEWTLAGPQRWPTFQRCCWSECNMSFCRDNWAKHDIYPSMERSCDSTPSRQMFHHQQGEYHRQCRWPTPENHRLIFS